MFSCFIGNNIVMKLKRRSMYICMIKHKYKHIHYLTRTEMKMANARKSFSLRQYKLSKRNCFQAHIYSHDAFYAFYNLREFSYFFCCCFYFAKIMLDVHKFFMYHCTRLYLCHVTQM